MVANVLKYFLTWIGALYFLLAGTGYNIVKFCCDDCAHQGVEVLMQNECETVHHHDEAPICRNTGDHPHTLIFSDEITSTCHADSHCELVRIESDVFAVSETTSGVKRFTTYDFISLYSIDSFSITTPYLSRSVRKLPPLSQFTQTGRVILTQKSVLII